MKLLTLATIFLLVGTIGFAYSEVNAQGGEFNLTINPGATDSNSLNPIKPANITIPVGATVVWLNKDSAYHQIVSGTPEAGPTNVFYGDFFATNEAFNRTFDSAGVIDYYDPIWTNIKGQITIVNENNTESGLNTTDNLANNNFTNSDVNTGNKTSLINEPLQSSAGQPFQSNNVNTPDQGSLNQQQTGVIGDNTQSFTTDQQQQQPVQQQQISQDQLQIPQHGTIDSFKANGKINSFIVTAVSPWNATGDWSMIVEDGEMKNFVTNMAWFNGTTGHTHDFLNFDSRDDIELPPDNILSIDGEMDVASNGVITWDGVDSTINLGGGGKTITILVDHEATDHHFAGQPIIGTVTSLTPCSDTPGASMEILPTCD